MNVPSNSWLRHALLYWDEVSSIIPQSSNNKFLHRVSADIHYLMDKGQFRPMKPEDLIMKADNREAFEAFREEFIDIVQSPSFQKFVKRRKEALLYKISRDKVIANPFYSQIHKNKTSNALLDFLKERDLINTRKSNSDWLMFERNTALLYMSLLAKYLAQIDKRQTTLGTDHAIYERFNFKRAKESDSFPIISFNIFNILPTPKANVPLEHIIDFKRKRKDELFQFRKTLLEFQKKISNASSNQEIRELATNFQESIKLGVGDLSRALKDSRMETILRSLRSLISIKSPSALLAGAAIANEKFNFIEAPIYLKVLGLGSIGLIELTGNFIEARNKEIAKAKDSAFSYLLHAHKMGLLKLKSSN
jgi:hypothetical protein